ncbi:hypothetical protein F5Y14DRAFT_59608 [Nemania sp. NC0429]|nr:hypothetical protein F5Y14DRAFT_59608 [Nemania sp. NC0429]
MQSRSVLLNIALYCGFASAITRTFISSTTLSGCSYQLGSGGVPPTPIPVRTNTISTRLTVTNATETVLPTVTITAPKVTFTQHTAVDYTVVVPTITIPTSTKGFGTQLTVATGTFAATVCANGAKPVTVTKYTGTYVPISGQETKVRATYAVSGLCSYETRYTNVILPTETSGAAVTTTVTPTTTVYSYTTTTTLPYIDYTETSYLTTVSSTYTSYTPGGLTRTSTVACAEKTVTKTLDTRCAPTNLIDSINGEGLRSGRYADRVSVVYTRNEPWANDYSACCQACLDSEGCGASMGGGGACGLYYASTVGGQPVCDAFIFSFTSSPNAYPGQSLIIQSGCDSVSYQGSLP